MSLKVSCPNCSHSFSIKPPKPGKYKPKCTHCETTFLLIVGEGDPLTVKTIQLEPEKPAATKPTATKPTATNQTASNPEKVSAADPKPQGLSSSAAPDSQTKTAVSGFEATLDSSLNSPSAGPTHPVAKSPSPNVTAAFDATMPEPLGTGSVSSSSAPSHAQSPTAIGQSVSGFDVTMDSQTSSLASRPSGFDITMDSQMSGLVSKPSGFDVTLGEPSSSVSASNVSSAKSNRDFSVDDVTMESAPSQHSDRPSIPASSSLNSGSPSSSPPSLEGVDRLGGYRIIKELGAGGMGSVYLAKQISLDRSCALKTIQSHWASNPRVIARFIREAYAAAQLTHHNVVQIYDLGQDRGTNFFSMELVSGGSLDDQLKNKGKLPPKLAATLILQAARGLKFAHDHGMVHRDIKPANLMLTSDGLVKIADLGLVKTPSAEDDGGSPDSDVQSMMLASARSQVTQMGSSMGTPSYMSPEQALDAASVDKRADIYSLGCTFYALLTGKPPFEGKTLMEVLSKHRMEKIVRPERIITNLPNALGDIIEKMTEKKPEDRYQDLQDVIEDLEVFLELREDLSGAKIEHDHRDRQEIDTMDSQAKAEPPDNKPSPAKPAPDKPSRAKPIPAKPSGLKPSAAVIPEELAGKIDVAAKRFQKSPLLLIRGLAPKAWIGLCGFLSVLSILFAVWSLFTLIGEGASSLTSTVKQSLGSGEANDATANTASAAVNTSGSSAESTSVSSKLSALFQNVISRSKSALGFALAGFLAPIVAVFLGGLEGKSPLAQRYRESFLAGGLWNWLYWGFAVIVALLVVYFLSLWLPVTLAILFAGAAGAVYCYGIEKPLAAQRKGAIDQAQTVVRQLRLRGTQEESIREAFAKHAGNHWEELFEHVFGYSEMRLMRSKLQKDSRSSHYNFRPYRDKLIDRLDEQLAQSRRRKEEKVLANSEKAELVAKGISVAEAQKQAEALAASMVDAADETKQTMREIALGKLTEAAAEAKRQRIKQMLADARSGKISDKERKSRTINAIMGHLLGSKFRFACAAVLLLGVGMWVKANQKPLEKYWQQASATIQNTKLEGGLAGAKATLSKVQDEAKKSAADAAKQTWIPVLGGLVNERNVIYVTLAGALMLFGTLWYGWKISFAFLPLTILILCIPMFL